MGTSEDDGGVSECRFIPTKQRNKRKSIMKDNGDSGEKSRKISERDRKAGWLDDAAAGTDTSDYDPWQAIYLNTGWSQILPTLRSLGSRNTWAK